MDLNTLWTITTHWVGQHGQAWAPVAAGVFVVGIGLAEAARGLLWARRARAWVATDAILTRAELRWEDGSVFEPGKGGRGEFGGVWRPDLEFVFEADGVPMAGTRLAPAGDAGWSVRSLAQETLAGLTVGSVVRAYYDPRDPNRSCLRPERVGSAPAGLAIAAIGVVWSIAAAVHAMA
jgi:hypothetical protein